MNECLLLPLEYILFTIITQLYIHVPFLAVFATFCFLIVADSLHNLYPSFSVFLAVLPICDTDVTNAGNLKLSTREPLSVYILYECSYSV